jgi:hypothetical protein
MKKVFRPQSMNPVFAIKYRRETGHGVGEFNWQRRELWVRYVDRNRTHLIRVFNRLHYLGGHAPLPVRKRWHTVEQQFINRYIPNNASLRYTNTHGSWL